MNIILLISLILTSVSGVFALVKQYQMLQQNSYFPSRYFAWVKDGYFVSYIIECLVFCLTAVFLNFKLFIPLLILSVILLSVRIFSAVKVQKKSIKKLVFTARIKRLFGAAVFVLTVFIILSALLKTTVAGNIFAVLSLLSSVISPLLTFLCRFLTAPIENSVTKWYINDAKQILKEHKNLTVIGITGSYGKTTTKFILNRILSEEYNVVATPQSFNTPMGVVRTIREKIEPQTEIFICEMGAKNIGDIKEICDIVHPKYGIITSVGEQHLETFKTVDNVFKTKFELANEVLKNDGEVFVNGDSAELIKRIDKSLYTVYGTDKDFDFSAENISYGKNGSSFSVSGTELSSKLLGLHSIINITGAVALALKLDVKPQNIGFAVGTLKPTEHRLELKPYINGSTLIDDAYNANPEGSAEAVNVLSSFGDMKKVIVTPGLIELGAKEYECNFNLGVEAAEKCDIIILVGKNRSKPIYEGVLSVGFNEENLYTVGSFKEAMSVYGRIADTNTVVLLENDLPDNYLN